MKVNYQDGGGVTGSHTTRALCLAGLICLSHCGNERGPLQVQSGPGAQLSISESPSYDFGSLFVDGSIDKTFTVTNTGPVGASQLSGSFNLSLNFSYKDGNYPGTGGSCASSLAPQASCTVVVSFAPRYVGVFDEVLQIGYHNGNQQQTTGHPALKGKGIWDHPGNPDTTFQTSGRIIHSFGSLPEHANAIAFTPEGKFIAAGYAANGTDTDFLVTRHHANGRLDEAFGSAGKIMMAIGDGDDSAHGVALQHDGKIVIAGSASVAGVKSVALVRLESDGSKDGSFGNGGLVLTSAGTGNAEAFHVAIQGDRKIVVAGYAMNGAGKDLLAARYAGSGEPDASFGVAGVLLVDMMGGDDVAHSIALADGKIVLVGESDIGAQLDFAIVRLLDTSALDPSLNGTGKLLVGVGNGTDDVATASQVQVDSRLVVVGKTSATDEDFAAIRLNTDGSLDTSFGTAGKAVIPFGASTDSAHALLIQQDRKILIIGESNGAPAIARLQSSGTLDPVFGSNGKVVAPVSGAFRAAAFHANGKPVLAGFTNAGSDADLLFARYWP